MECGDYVTFSIVNLSNASFKWPRIMFFFSSGMVERWIFTWNHGQCCKLKNHLILITFLFDLEIAGASDIVFFINLIMLECLWWTGRFTLTEIGIFYVYLCYQQRNFVLDTYCMLIVIEVCPHGTYAVNNRTFNPTWTSNDNDMSL